MPLADGLEEALLFLGFSTSVTRAGRARQFGIGLAHLGHQVGHQLVEERRAGPSL